MARLIERLSPAKVQKTTAPGLYADGAGLYLNVGPTGGKSWVLRYTISGKAREMGLGALHTIGLAEARDLARNCRRQLFDGADPLEARKAARAARQLEAARAITFQDAAARYIRAHQAAWQNAKHAEQWQSTLNTYAFPTIGGSSVGAIETGDVARILEPIWTTKPETATRVRGRIEAILDYARTHGWRQGDNPARWRGHLENILPRRSKVAKVEHHAALPWREVAGFVRALGGQEGIAPLALRFGILTAARTGEIIGATWDEISPDEKAWTVPADRMKGGREHRVPLTQAALAVLEAVKPLREAARGDFVFPGGKAGRPLSNMAMLKLLERMGRTDLTVHGFRSTFRDWASEATAFAGDVAEAALAHAIKGKVEAAYRRGDLFEKRREMMEAWADYCRGAGASK